MENLHGYKSLLNEIEEFISKLEKGQLTKDELVTLEQRTRELHERSVILKYKAFESFVNGSAEVNAPIAVPVPEEIPAQTNPEPEVPEIVFSLFDDTPTEATSNEPEVDKVETMESFPEPEMTSNREPIDAPTDASSLPNEAPSEQEYKVASSGSPFIDKVNKSGRSMESHFPGTSLTTLIGAFGLNERLRYINELFNGSSEAFGDAVKSLDGCADLNDALSRIEGLASNYQWDAEDEVVFEFLTVIRRRYA